MTWLINDFSDNVIDTKDAGYSSSESEEETAAEKKLRLAKQYLAQIEQEGNKMQLYFHVIWRIGHSILYCKGCQVHNVIMYCSLNHIMHMAFNIDVSLVSSFFWVIYFQNFFLVTIVVIDVANFHVSDS